MKKTEYFIIRAHLYCTNHKETIAIWIPRGGPLEHDQLGGKITTNGSRARRCTFMRRTFCDEGLILKRKEQNVRCRFGCMGIQCYFASPKRLFYPKNGPHDPDLFKISPEIFYNELTDFTKTFHLFNNKTALLLEYDDLSEFYDTVRAEVLGGSNIPPTQGYFYSAEYDWDFEDDFVSIAYLWSESQLSQTEKGSIILKEAEEAEEINIYE